jgi:flagellar hook-basal body protein
MMKSLYSGVSGLKVHNQRMDVIGNNIANVNTTAFKGSTVTFNDVFYQTKSYASSGSATSGGSNPTQVGYGAALGTISQVMSQSGFTYSDSVYDCAIQGEGFFQVMDQAGNIFYSRNGKFSVDDYGNLVDTGNNIVLGTTGDPTGQAARSERLNLFVPPVNNNRASATSSYDGYEITFTAADYGPTGNLSIYLQQNDTPFAQLSGSNLTVQLDLTQEFASQQEFEDAVNAAILAGGVNIDQAVLPISIDFDGLPAVTTASNAHNVMEFILPDASKTYFNIETTMPGAYGNAYEMDVKVSTNATEPLVKWAENILTITLPGKTVTKTIAKQVTDEDGNVTDDPNYTELYNQIHGEDGGDGDGSLVGAVNEAQAALIEAQRALDEAAAAAGGGTGEDDDGGDTDLTELITARDTAKEALETAQEALVDAETQLAQYSKTVEELVYPSTVDTMINEINLAIMKAAGATPIENPDPDAVEAYNAAIALINGTTNEDGEEVPGLLTLYNEAEEAYAYAKEMLDLMDANVDPELFAQQSAEVTQLRNEADIALSALNRQQTVVNDLFNKAYYEGGDSEKFLKLSISNIDGETGVTANPAVVAPTLQDLVESVNTNTKRVGLANGTDNFYSEVAQHLGTISMTGGRFAEDQGVDDLSLVYIDDTGVIYGEHNVHGTLLLGRIDIATFTNPVGLQQAGTSYWQASLNSGPAEVKIAGESGAGSLVSNALEMSNVDLSQEFSDMIITQRGFQANSRIITVSDTMLEELVNLKR